MNDVPRTEREYRSFEEYKKQFFSSSRNAKAAMRKLSASKFGLALARRSLRTLREILRDDESTRA
jgi:hypothetical protein